MSDRRPTRVSLAVALVALLAVAAACGDGGASATDSGGGLGKTELTIGLIPVIDDAPFYIAKKRGFFKDEGLTVSISQNRSSSAGVQKAHSGDVDIAYATYASLFKAHAKGGLKMHIVAEGYVLQTGTMPILAMPGSGIKQPKDLAGKRIAVLSPSNVQGLMTKSRLQTFGVNSKEVEYVTVPFPKMPAALKKGEVDAAVAVEPFVTAMKKNLGAHVVMNLVKGATDDFPISGYASSQEFYEKYPKTVAAFKRAIQRAQKVANDRAAVEKILPTYMPIEPETAAIVAIGQYPTTVEPTRLQRVADLMHRFEVLKKELNVKKLTS